MTPSVAIRLAELLLLGLLLAPGEARAEGALTARRVAIVVGANAPAPGRKPLRFAHQDARAVADVLRSQGGFAGEDVRLLFDPEPGEVLGALDAALRDAARSRVDTLVLFYYSGHADTASLFPGGRALLLADLRKRLDDGRAAMRIGIIDACRGGGWTGSKGLSDAQTFDVDQALDLATEGSVLIASSSGMEDAHESLALRGSFFTHHWNAALRGAADRNGDDKVTLGEAFEYARSLTIRDTAINTEQPQHPSFRFNLRGRGDPPLAELSPGSSVVELDQERGPLQVIHLGTGLLVVELPAGRRQARVSLPPGRYVVRRREGDAVLARELRLGAGQRLNVVESTLTRVGAGSFEAKGAGPAPEEPLPEFMLSFLWGRPTFHASYRYGSETYSSRTENSYWGIQGSYLLRHGRHLATRLGAGFARPESFGDGSIIATVGESISWPLVKERENVAWTSSHAIEPYLSANLSARAELDREKGELPYQLQAGLAGGIRFYLLYVQVGYVMDLLPSEVTLYSAEDRTNLDQPRPGLAAEAGFRVVKNFD